MSALLTELREAGLAMGTSYAPASFTDPETKEDHVSQLHVGYTTDMAKAEKARAAGATVTSCASRGTSLLGLGDHCAGDRPVTGGIIYHCAECGQRLNIVDGYALCSRCNFDLTGEDSERDEREARERLGAAESPREGTEA